MTIIVNVVAVIAAIVVIVIIVMNQEYYEMNFIMIHRKYHFFLI